MDYFTKVVFYGIIIFVWLMKLQTYIIRKVGDDGCHEIMNWIH